MVYQLGKDTNKNPLKEKTFYINTKTGEVMQLFRDAAGFRVEYGTGGRCPNIFDLSEGPKYRPMTQQDFEKAISDSSKRKSWLEGGLVAITSSSNLPEPQIPKRSDAMTNCIPKEESPKVEEKDPYAGYQIFNS
jgi:hypothetical protein